MTAYVKEPIRSCSTQVFLTNKISKEENEKKFRKDPEFGIELMEKMKMMYNNGDIIKDCNRNIVANLTVSNIAYKLLCMYEVWSSWKRK